MTKASNTNSWTKDRGVQAQGFKKLFVHRGGWQNRGALSLVADVRQRLANVSVDQEATGRTLVGQPFTDTPPLSPGLSFSRFHSLEKLGAKHSDASLETSQIGRYASHALCLLPSLPQPPLSLCHYVLSLVPSIPSLGQLGLSTGWVAILGSVWEEKWVLFLAELLWRDRGPWNRQRQGKELRPRVPPEEIHFSLQKTMAGVSTGVIIRSTSILFFLSLVLMAKMIKS